MSESGVNRSSRVGSGRVPFALTVLGSQAQEGLLNSSSARYCLCAPRFFCVDRDFSVHCERFVRRQAGECNFRPGDASAIFRWPAATAYQLSDLLRNLLSLYASFLRSVLFSLTGSCYRRNCVTGRDTDSETFRDQYAWISKQ